MQNVYATNQNDNPTNISWLLHTFWVAEEAGQPLSLIHILHNLTQYPGRFELGQAPTTKEAQAIADALYSEFVGLDCDKVELVYTKFVSLISSDPIIQTLLPLTPQV